MTTCTMCQRQIHESLKWSWIWQNQQDTKVCHSCLTNAKMYQKALEDYLKHNHFHLREYLSLVVASRFKKQKCHIVTKGYVRKEKNLYDEAYAICELFTPCVSLTPTIMNTENRIKTSDLLDVVVGFDDTCDVNLWKVLEIDNVKNKNRS